jgi:hypothetical protein
MRSHIVLLIAAGFSLAVAPVFAAEAVSPDKTPSKKYVAPRTPDGHPDFSGVWSNASTVPLERPKNFGEREFLTAEEVAAAEAKAAVPRPVEEQAAGVGDAHYDMTQFGLDRSHTKYAKSVRTSLITGPEGKIPPMLPEAQKRQQERAAYTRAHSFDSAQDRGLSERCIIWNNNEGPPILPQGYNSNLEIVQGQGYIAIDIEMIHDVRVIPTDGRPHLPANIKQWLGDSRAHWEGDTLVIDTTNYSERTNFRGATDSLHVVERLSRVDENTLLYQFTVEDPKTWTKPWSGEVPILKTNDKMYEYACHEGNLGMPNVLSGARTAEERAAAQGK